MKFYTDFEYDLLLSNERSEARVHNLVARWGRLGGRGVKEWGRV
jgi:hypothetical protein